MVPYESDQHLYGLFRSFIEIPDGIFPDQWRDVDDGEEDSGLKEEDLLTEFETEFKEKGEL